MSRRKIHDKIEVGSRVRRKPVNKAEPDNNLIEGTVTEINVFNRAHVIWDAARVNRGKETWYALSGLALVESKSPETELTSTDLEP